MVPTCKKKKNLHIDLTSNGNWISLWHGEPLLEVDSFGFLICKIQGLSPRRTTKVKKHPRWALSIFSYTELFSSAAQSCPTLCNPVDCSTPGLSVHHQFLELAQTVH